MALAVYQVAGELLQCAYEGVDHDDELAINRLCMVPGEIAWDNCQCGQLVITEVRRYPSVRFPLDEVDHTAECGAPWLVVNLQLGLARCVPTVDEEGEPPSCDDLTTAAVQLSRDMGMMRSAVECCLDHMFNDGEVTAYELSAQEVVGPLGGCVGFTLDVQIGIANGCGCG